MTARHLNASKAHGGISATKAARRAAALARTCTACGAEPGVLCGRWSGRVHRYPDRPVFWTENATLHPARVAGTTAAPGGTSNVRREIFQEGETRPVEAVLTWGDSHARPVLDDVNGSTRAPTWAVLLAVRDETR